MVCKSSQVLLLLIFAILALYAYTESVSAADKYCAADGGFTRHVSGQDCDDQYEYKNCEQWCLDRKKWFDKHYIIKGKLESSWRNLYIPKYSGDTCVCCCKDAIPGKTPPPSPPRANKYCPANNIEIYERLVLLGGCGKADVYNNCADLCIQKSRTYAKRLDVGGNCICCCADVKPPPPCPPPPALPPPPACQECVCALNNRYCPANNIERVWPNMICGDGASADFNHCQSWCAVRGRSYTTNRYPLKDGRDDCVCCCGDPLRSPPFPPRPLASNPSASPPSPTSLAPNPSGSPPSPSFPPASPPSPSLSPQFAPNPSAFPSPSFPPPFSPNPSSSPPSPSVPPPFTHNPSASPPSPSLPLPFAPNPSSSPPSPPFAPNPSSSPPSPSLPPPFAPNPSSSSPSSPSFPPALPPSPSFPPPFAPNPSVSPPYPSLPPPLSPSPASPPSPTLPQPLSPSPSASPPSQTLPPPLAPIQSATLLSPTIPPPFAPNPSSPPPSDSENTERRLAYETSCTEVTLLDCHNKCAEENGKERLAYESELSQPPSDCLIHCCWTAAVKQAPVHDHNQQ
ncbi:protein transport protein sec31-like [Papaver somniferum]|uniref:protein transport protein sec31-like n=1 Tax=Papaver somniferum TaxID=3469 RepID=UPI000E702D3A|nr:protein transport protein sec31-like [Papaver somniferum]